MHGSYRNMTRRSEKSALDNQDPNQPVEYSFVIPKELKMQQSNNYNSSIQYKGAGLSVDSQAHLASTEERNV